MCLDYSDLYSLLNRKEYENERTKWRRKKNTHTYHTDRQTTPIYYIYIYNIDAWHADERLNTEPYVCLGGVLWVVPRQANSRYLLLWNGTCSCTDDSRWCRRFYFAAVDINVFVAVAASRCHASPFTRIFALAYYYRLTADGVVLLRGAKLREQHTAPPPNWKFQCQNIIWGG